MSALGLAAPPYPDATPAQRAQLFIMENLRTLQDNKDWPMH
jgi:hypothetical protein